MPSHVQIVSGLKAQQFVCDDELFPFFLKEEPVVRKLPWGYEITVTMFAEQVDHRVTPWMLDPETGKPLLPKSDKFFRSERPNGHFEEV